MADPVPYDAITELYRITNGLIERPPVGQDKTECGNASTNDGAANVAVPSAGPSTLPILGKTSEVQEYSRIFCPPTGPISDEMRRLLFSLRKFCTNPIVPKREGPKLADSTFQSLERRLVGFCRHVQCKEVRPATVDDFFNITSIEEYAQSLHECKHRSLVTVARNIGATGRNLCSPGRRSGTRQNTSAQVRPRRSSRP